MRSIWGISKIKRKLHERKAKHENETTEQRAARVTATATAWIAWFTVILAAASLLTLYEVVEGGKDTHVLAEAAKAQADAAVKLAEAAASQAKSASAQISKLDVANQQTRSLAQTARQSLETARDNFDADQSPIVWVNPQEPQFRAGEIGTWNVTFSNYGRSPAFNERQCMGMTYGPMALALVTAPTFRACGTRNLSNSRGVLPPSFAGFTTVVTIAPLSQQQLNVLESIDGAFVVTGIFEYEDRDGHAFRTTFCSYRLATGAVATCHDYNGIERIHRNLHN